MITVVIRALCDITMGSTTMFGTEEEPAGEKLVSSPARSLSSSYLHGVDGDGQSRVSPGHLLLLLLLGRVGQLDLLLVAQVDAVDGQHHQQHQRGDAHDDDHGGGARDSWGSEEEHSGESRGATEAPLALKCSSKQQEVKNVNSLDGF